MGRPGVEFMAGRLANPNHMAINPIIQLAQTVDRRLRQAGDKSPGVRRLTKLFEVIHFTSTVPQVHACFWR